jgi:hypothetical protein
MSVNQPEIPLEDVVAVEVEVANNNDAKHLLTEKEKRKAMIEEELTNIINVLTERTRLEDEMEPEAIAALKKAALIVVYRKKYYDVFKDKFILFPTVAAALINYALIEEAEKYYYEDDDEFPMEYTKALRSVAFMLGVDESDDVDEAYMERLGMDVDIGEDVDVSENNKDEEGVHQDVASVLDDEANQDDKAQKSNGE